MSGYSRDNSPDDPFGSHSGSSPSGIFSLTPAAEFALRLISRLHRTTSTESFYQSSELHEIRDAEERAPAAHDDLRIGGNEVSPLRRHGANSTVINLEQQTPAIAGMPLAHAGELPSAVGMERMRDPDKARRYEGNTCIPD